MSRLSSAANLSRRFDRSHHRRQRLGRGSDPTKCTHAFPTARVIRNQTNLGFAAGNNRGAAASTGEYIVFLNDDTRAHPDWLRRARGTARRRDAAAVASYILDWSGTTVDFVDRAVNFQGKGFQLRLRHGGRRALTPRGKAAPLCLRLRHAGRSRPCSTRPADGTKEPSLTTRTSSSAGACTSLATTCGFAPRPSSITSITARPEDGPNRLVCGCTSATRFVTCSCLLERTSLGRALSAALLLAADRALLETGLSRAADTTQESLYRRLKDAGRAALRARGISRSTPIAQALSRVWQGGLLSLARDVLRLGAVNRARAANRT